MAPQRLTRAAVLAGKIITGGFRAGIRTLAANVTLTAKDEGKTLVLSVLTGLVAILPAATGTGRVFRFKVGLTVTSNGYIIKVANATDIMQGTALAAADGGNTLNAWEAGATADTITLDGSTTGGLVGDDIELQDIAAGLWAVRAVLQQTGTEATPFSATVS